MRYALIVLVVFVSSSAVSAQSMFDRVNDFDGDGRADYAVIRDEGGQKVWYLWRSTAGYLVVPWGLTNDVVTAGDYDGDLRTDIAVTRVANGPGGNQQWIITTYYIASSNGAVGTILLETPNAVGSSAVSNEDYDGDGKTDVGFFQWHAIGGLTYRKSSTGTVAGVSMTWFLVRTGDLIGNGAADVTSNNPNSGETTIANAAEGGQVTLRWGVFGDRWVAADFDGDNKGDIAIFRASTGEWWWMRSSDSVVNVVRWGINGDIPVPADYDNDSKSDQAVYRPGSPNGVFWVNGSSGASHAFAWGIQGDTPVRY